MGLNLRPLAFACLITLVVLGPPARADGRLSPQGGTITAVGATAGGGLTGGGTGGPVYVGIQPCSTGQGMVWNGVAYACGDIASKVAGTLHSLACFTPDGSHVGNCNATDDGTILTVNETLGVNTSGQTLHISSFHGANADGHNIWIGDGGLNSVGALGNTTLGSYNLSAGAGALAANTTGNKSVGIGYHALNANTTGSDLVGVGFEALLSNTTGSGSVGIGYQSLRANTSGSELVGIGTQTLFANTSGSQIVGIGYTALAGNTTGNNLVGVGAEAAIANTTGNSSVGVGSLSLHSNTTGSNLVGVGYQALYDLNITANDGSGSNTAVGANTGRGIVTGTNNTIIGANVTGLAASLSGQIIIADGAGNKRIQVNSSAQTTLAGTLQIMGTGATWTSGTGAPAISCAKGDKFSRTDGGVGTTLYTCTATNTWTALSSTTGTVTSVATGNGLTGGTITTTGTLSVNNGNGLVFATGALTYDSSIIQSRVSGTCTGPNAIRAVNSDGTVTCTTGVSTLTNGAGNNVIPKSDGTNLVASSLSDNATIVWTTEAVSVGTATGVGKFSVLSGNSGAAGGTAIANATWDTNYSIFGPNVASGTGAVLALAYSTTDDTAKVISAKPGNAWKGLDLLGSQLRVYINGSVQATLSSTTFAMTGAGTFSTTLGVTGATTLSSTLHTVGATTLDSTLRAGISTIGGAAGTSSVTGTALIVSNAGQTNLAIRDTTDSTEIEMMTNATAAYIGTSTSTSLHMIVAGSDIIVLGGAGINVTGGIGATGAVSGAGISYANNGIDDSGTLYTLASGTIVGTRGATSGSFTATATTDTVTFGGGATLANPSCIISTNGTVKGYAYVESATGIAFSSLTVGQKYGFFCPGH